MRARDLGGLLELAHPRERRDRRLVDAEDVVGVADLGEEVEPLSRERCRLVELQLLERDRRPRRPRVGPQLDVAHPIGDRARLAGRLGAPCRTEERAGRERLCARSALGRRELEGPLDPLVDRDDVDAVGPHPGPEAVW